MDLSVLALLLRQVIRHVFGQQVAPVAGGVDQHVGRGSAHRAVQDRFHRLVAGLAFFKAQVIAINDEFLGAARHHIHNIGQIGQVGFVHLDQAQPLGCVAVQAGTN
ncbi:hypothetical protein D3C72_1966350 [compost metagenome]